LGAIGFQVQNRQIFGHKCQRKTSKKYMIFLKDSAEISGELSDPNAKLEIQSKIKEGLDKI
jgi:hypothetical protein